MILRECHNIGRFWPKLGETPAFGMVLKPETTRS